MKLKIERLTITIEGSIDIQMDTPKATDDAGKTNAVSKQSDGNNQSIPKASDEKNEAETEDNKAVSQSNEKEKTTENCKAEDCGKADAGNAERMMTREEELMMLRKRIVDIQETLRTAKDSKDISNAMDNLEGLLKDSAHDSTLGTYVPNLVGEVHAMRIHDVTRSEMDRSLQMLLDAIDSAIEQAKDSERAEKLEQLLRGLAANSAVIYAAMKENGTSDFLDKLF